MPVQKKAPMRARKKAREDTCVKLSEVTPLTQENLQEASCVRRSEVPPETFYEPPPIRLHGIAIRKVTIKLEDGSVIKGKINLRTELAHLSESFNSYSLDSGAYYTKVSDLFTKGRNPFVEIFEVEDYDDGKVLIINKSKVLWISAEDGRG